MPDSKPLRILTGDIGGTNTRLAIWTADANLPNGGLRQTHAPAKFKNAGTRSLDETLEKYLAQVDGDAGTDGPITDACFGVAGPVQGRSVQMTNIQAWPKIEADAIAKRLKIDQPHRVNLINDMPAHAASIDGLLGQSPESIVTIRAGKPRTNGARAIVMPGTGLGIGAMIWDARGQLHRPIPTEAGHADVPTRDRETTELIESMRRFHADVAGIVTREHVISGPGLRAIYACLKNPDDPKPDAAPKAEDLLSLEASDLIAKRTLDLFTRLLGELCGCVAFDYLATGGIYVGGSIANSLKSRLSGPRFNDAFAQTGPPNLRKLIDCVPVTLVTYADTGLLGAATYATWVEAGRV